jgi:predicted ATPase
MQENTIKKIKIVSFKSIEKAEIELGKVNVFIGANGSGKSNLLEALGVLGAAASGQVDDESLLRRGVRPGVPALYKSSFKGTRQPKEIMFSACNNAAEYSVGLYNPLEKPRPAWHYKTELLTEDGTKLVGRSPRSKEKLNPYRGYAALKSVELESNDGASSLLEALSQYCVFSPNTASLRGLESDSSSRIPVGISGARLAEAVHELFAGDNKVSDDVYFSILRLIGWVRGLGSSDGSLVPVSKSVNQPRIVLRFRDKYMAEGRNYLSGYDASEGALYVLFMAVLALHKNSPSTVAVDNFDHALNPRLAKALTAQICEWTNSTSSKQFLLTSHNPLVLDGLPLQNDDVRLFVVQRTRHGKTVISRVVLDDKIISAAKDGVSLSQMWIMGVLGGVPQDL